MMINKDTVESLSKMADKAVKEAAEFRARVDEILAADKKEEPRPFGRLWDNNKYCGVYGYHESIAKNADYPHALFNTPCGNSRVASFIHFKAIDEAILPQPLPVCEGYKYPGDPDDLILLLGLNCSNAAKAQSLYFSQANTKYYLLKKAGGE